MQWTDAKLTWDPMKYGNITSLHIPSDIIWIPDIVLYNNAAGDPDITIFTDALVLHTGRVHWNPPAIYKSFCPIDVTWFPYDEQSCEMKFGAWSYTGMYVDMRHLSGDKVVTKDVDGADVELLENGMDLSFFYRSAEWDLLSLTARRHSVLYASCCGPENYIDITYYFVLRRKTLFFTCNLIIPCFLIAMLTTFVFYLPDHKITFSISILVTLTVFFLVLIDIIPPTSLVVPMFGRYLITTMILVALSTVISVVTVNFRFRSGSAHKMSPWIRAIFLNFLPKLLLMNRPEKAPEEEEEATNLVDPSSLIAVPTLAYPLPNTSINKSSKNEKKKFAGEKLKNTKMAMTDFSISSRIGGGKNPPKYNDNEDEKTPFMMENTSFGNNSTCPNGADPHSLSLPNRKSIVSDPKKIKKRVNDMIFYNLIRQVKFIAEHFRRNHDEREVFNFI
uniref:Uncharacterized protein n=1 Tax=Panagrolaimus sp. PS1159 TaxID=55785 RepID=A0AC35FNW9_9BILA